MSPLLSEIREIVAQARSWAYSAVNTAMVQAYWLIGKRIVEEEQHGQERAQYGRQIVKTLSKELTAEFGKGFSTTNIQYFRQFYLIFPDSGIRHTVCADSDTAKHRTLSGEFDKINDSSLLSRLSWSHIVLILKIVDPRTCLLPQRGCIYQLRVTP